MKTGVDKDSYSSPLPVGSYIREGGTFTGEWVELIIESKTVYHFTVLI